jgi:hypothetical protein
MPYNLQESSCDRHISSRSEQPLSESYDTSTSENPFVMVGNGFSIRLMERSTLIHMAAGARTPLTCCVCGSTDTVPFKFGARSRYQNIILNG